MITLAHLIQSFAEDMQIAIANGTAEQATLDWYRHQFRKLDKLRDVPAEALKLHHLAGIKLKNAFVRAIKRLYRWGVDNDLVPKDPFAKLAIPPCGRRERVLSRDEMCRLYRACSRPLRRLLFVQVATLARPGEVRCLTWGQIDWERRVILLTKFKAKNRRKDGAKVRAISMPLPVVRLLRNLWRKSKDQSPTGRVFIAVRGEPWTANGLRCAMRGARERCGLADGPEKVTCYHMRHTGATEAVRANVDLKHLAEVMGHTRVTTTERYVHLEVRDMVATVDRLWLHRRTSRSA